MHYLKEDEYSDEKSQMTAQRTIKFYNALSKDLTLFEYQQYKAWFENVHYAFDLLSQPVIRRNLNTSKLEVNFDITILNTLEESKKMIKLHLGRNKPWFDCLCSYLKLLSSWNFAGFSTSIDIPHLGHALVKYEDELKSKLRMMRHLIIRTNALRMSVEIVFVSIMRPQLKKIDRAFKAGLSQIQWLSNDFGAYVKNVEKVNFFDLQLKFFPNFF